MMGLYEFVTGGWQNFVSVREIGELLFTLVVAYGFSIPYDVTASILFLIGYLIGRRGGWFR